MPAAEKPSVGSDKPSALSKDIPKAAAAAAAKAPAASAEPDDPDKRPAASLGARLEAGVRGERFGNGVGTNYGNIFAPVHMGGPAQAQAPKFSFQEDLRALSRAPDVPMPLPFDAALVDRYLAVVRQGRVLVIEHGRSRRHDAEAALNCMVSALHKGQGDKQLLTGVVERLFPLDELCMTPSWAEHCRRSIIFLDRSDDGKAGEFFCRSSNRSLLRQQLAQHDCYLVATVASLGGDGALSDAEHCWRLSDSAAPTGGEPLGQCPEAFDALLLLCAIWFPGLAPAEFNLLIDRMRTPSVPAPPPAPPLAPALPMALAGQVAVALPPPPTHAQRWCEGDRDRVLGELGISLFRAGPLADAGYRLSAGQQGAGEWTLRQFPMLLLQQLDVLGRHYFEAGASTRYRSGLRDLLFALDSVGASRLEADWLVERCFDALATGDSQAVADQLVELLVSGLSRSDGKRLAEEVAARLAQEVLDQDAGLRPELPVDGLPAAWLTLCKQLGRSLDGCQAAADLGSAEPVTDLDASDSFWSWILGNSAPASNVVSALPKMLVAVRALLLLGEYLPQVALPQLLRVYEPGPLDAAIWAVPQWLPVRIVRLHRMVLLNQMFQIAKANPRCWLACTEAAASAFGCATGLAPVPQGYLAPSGAGFGAGIRIQVSASATFGSVLRLSTDGAPARRALAYDCLAVLAGLIDDLDGVLQAPLWFESMFGATQCPQMARALTLLGPLLRLDGDVVEGGESIDVDDLVWIFRVSARAMLDRDPTDPAGVAARMTELAWPLRRQLSAAQRGGIVDRVRTIQDLLNRRRDYFEGTGQRDELKQERLKLRAIQPVLRAFTGAAPANPADPNAFEGAKL